MDGKANPKQNAQAVGGYWLRRRSRRLSDGTSCRGGHCQRPVERDDRCRCQGSRPTRYRQYRDGQSSSRKTALREWTFRCGDRKSVVSGKRVAVRVYLGGRSWIQTNIVL